MDYLKKQKGWQRALAKFLAGNPPRPSLRLLELPFETRMEIASTQARVTTPTFVGREFDLLMVWQENKTGCVCLCSCGDYAAEVSANALMTGRAEDCGHRAIEARRIQRHRKVQKAKQRVKEGRAFRKLRGIAA